MFITKPELDSLALSLVNAMILEGPENEEQLHTLQVLLDPEQDDDLEAAVADAVAFIDVAYSGVEEMLEDIDMEEEE